MYIEQIYTNCLAEASYYIESNGEVAIIDPIREPQPYLELAVKRNSKIKYIFETHFHADFVSGHLDLSKHTGADIIYGPTAQAEYPIIIAEDMQIFKLGDIQIKVLHTPGHTMESSCFLLVDENDRDNAVFTGDTLFVGDVGRPDLAVKSDLTKETLARYLYQSIQNKLMTLTDDVIVYPGHGAGSQCGKALGKEKQSTIGEQKKYNYALNVSTENEFIEQVITGLNEPPQYFPKNAVINKTGYKSIEEVLNKSLKPLNAIEFNHYLEEKEILVLDTRSPENFSAQHIPNALNIGLDGFFAIWVGTLIEDLNMPILLVAEEGRERESVIRLARVGYENVIGYLEEGLELWSSNGYETKTVENIFPISFNEDTLSKYVLDVRTESEFMAGHVDNAINIPLAKLEKRLNELNKTDTCYIYCGSGYRSMIAASILSKHSFNNIINIKKGYEGIIDITRTCCCLKTINQ